MTGSIISPIHSALVGAGVLRFFRSPIAGPDLPWHVHDDLVACLGLPRDARRRFHHMLTSGPFKADVRVVATGGRIVTIAPHFAAQGLIRAAVQVDLARPSFESEYVDAAIAAFKMITGDLPPMAALEFAIAATKASLEMGS